MNRPTELNFYCITKPLPNKEISSTVTDSLKKIFIRLRGEVRRRRLEAGEAGWGQPAPSPARLPGISADKDFRVVVIGAGAQGIAHCQGMKSVKGIEICGLADINQERLQRAANFLGLAQHCRFTDAEQMLEQAAPLDLVCVATTAPSHVKLGRLALKHGVKRILLEKPIDTSLKDARAFDEECRAAGVQLVVNYSRRWALDYRAIKRCIKQNYIGEPRSISVNVGKGELAMHGSHYFDLCRYLLNSEPLWTLSKLEPVTEVNIRGVDFDDPSGFCLFGFENGARSYIDFSSDLINKDPFVTINGTSGRITVDEHRKSWTLQSRSQRIWNFPFAEPLKSSLLFSRVVAEVLSNKAPASGGADGIAALEMIIAARLSGQQTISFPLSSEESALNVEFP
jgi:predicted dehydrogenase